MHRLFLLVVIAALGTLPAATVDLLLTSASPTNGTSAGYLAVFSEPVDADSVSGGDFILDVAGNVSLGQITITPTEITATSFAIAVTWTDGNASATAVLRTAAQPAINASAGGALSLASAQAPPLVIDNASPAIAFINTTSNAAVTLTAPMVFQVVFTEAIQANSLAVGDFTPLFLQTGDTASAFLVTAVTAQSANVANVTVRPVDPTLAGVTGELSLRTAGGFQVSDLAGNTGSTAVNTSQILVIALSPGDNSLSVSALVGPRPAEVAVGGSIAVDLVVENPVVLGNVLQAFTFNSPPVTGATATGVLNGGKAIVTLTLPNVPAQAGGYLDFAVVHAGTRIPFLIKVTAPPAGNN